MNSISIQVTYVSKPLASVRLILDKGSAVTSSRSGPYILNEVPGEKIPNVGETMHFGDRRGVLGAGFCLAGLSVQDVHGEEAHKAQR